MLRKTIVLLGLAVLLSLLFPAKPWLKGVGMAPPDWRLSVLDLAALCALVAIAPAWVLFRDARVGPRIPRWSPWVMLLATCSLLFLLLHVSWSAELAEALAAGAIAEGVLPPWASQHALVDGLELAARVGVLLALVGVLLHLDTAPGEDAAGAPVRTARRKNA